MSNHNSVVAYAIREGREAKKYSLENEELDKKHYWKLRNSIEAAPKRLVFYWASNTHNKDVVELPFKLDSEGATDFALRWLNELDYGKEPDHDGDNSKGWRVYCEGWGQVDGEWGAFLAVAPAWAMYGK